MTVTEASRRLGLAEGSVRQSIARGRLRATKRGRDWWITESALEAYRDASLGKPGRKPAARQESTP